MPMVSDTCDICAGVQGPGHRHVCALCGADAGARALVVGDDSTENKFYCDQYCLDVGEGVGGGVADLVIAARNIRKQLAAAGIDWRVV
jgi:hypothetical protein